MICHFSKTLFPPLFCELCLSYDVAVIQWITSGHKNRMNTRVITLNRVDAVPDPRRGGGQKGYVPPLPPPPKSDHKAYLAPRKKLTIDLMTPKGHAKNGTSASCSF